MKRAPRLVRGLWRQITWRLFASYLVVGLAALGVIGVAGSIMASPRVGSALWLSNPETFHWRFVEGLLAAAAAAIVVSAGVSLFVSRRILEPLRQIMEASRRIAAGNYAERIPITDDFEVTELAASFNRMASAIEQTEQRRQALIADVAHELRTPLTSIKGYMEALIDEVLPPDQETFILIYKEADRLYRLVQDLQELSRLEAGQMALHPQPIPIAELVHSVLGRARPQFEAKGVRLSSGAGAEVGLVLGDPDRLCQVLLNLLSNALQYTPVGGRVEVVAYNERDRVCIGVQDTGIGIAPEHLTQIFSRFYRVDKSRSRLGGGTGIGLTIVKHLVEAHGGSIVVKSAPDLGSTFTIALPTFAAATTAGHGAGVPAGHLSPRPA